MKKIPLRLLGALLCLLLLISAVPAARAWEVGDAWHVDLSGFVKNEAYREYTEMMLDHYLRTDEKVKKALSDGYCAMFFFEGCSDHMDDPSMSDLTFFRVTSLCVVVKLDEQREPYIIYFSPNCSTIPDRPLKYGAWGFWDVGEVGPATICDGTYELYSVKHMGEYEALHMRDSLEDGDLAAVYMTPDGGYVTKDANSINIHTRTSNHTAGYGMWSAGCMLVGDGDYGQFLEMMQCTYYSIHDLFEVGLPVGTVTINRQNLREKLYDLYGNSDAVDMLLAESRRMLPETYLDGCTWLEVYQQERTMQTDTDAELMTLPCSNGSDARSRVATQLPKGTRVTLKAELRNREGGFWYETEYEGEICYISGADLEAIPEEGWFGRFWKGLFGL
jgi:hypothetical protein